MEFFAKKMTLQQARALLQVWNTCMVKISLEDALPRVYTQIHRD